MVTCSEFDECDVMQLGMWIMNGSSCIDSLKILYVLPLEDSCREDDHFWLY